MFDIEALDDTDFSWQIALNLALASQAAYLPGAAATETVKGWGFAHAEQVAAGDTQAIVAHNDAVAMFAFRGTESIGDWLTNIQIVGRDRPYGRVHNGFYRAFKDVRETLRQTLNDGNFRNVFYCGHSLGGALATIAMAELADAPAEFTAGYTCGQPKTGKKSFRRHFNERHGADFFRFVNDGDVVTRVPPAYRHVGQLHLLQEDATLESLPQETADLSEEEFEQLQADIEAALEQYRAMEANLESAAAVSEDEYLEGIIPGVAAHDMALYVTRIRERMENGGGNPTSR